MPPALNLLLAVAAVLLIVGQTGHIADLTVIATIAATCVTLLQWRGLAKMAQLFVAGALVIGPLTAYAFPAGQQELASALVQGVAFAILLASIGVMRYAVRRSATAQAAARYLVSVPGRSRYAAINVGCHFLSLLFNVGIIALIGELLGSERDGRLARAERQHLLLAGMRGTVLMTVWSPMGLGFAIVTSGIAGLDPVKFLALSFVSAALLLTVTCLAFGHGQTATPSVDDSEPRSIVPVVAILLASIVLLGLTVLLHEAAGMSFTIATATVIPLVSLAWVQLEPGKDDAGWSHHIAAMLKGLTDMRGEAAIFLSANVIGAAISIAVRAQPFWAGMQNGAYPDLAVIAACLVIVPLAGALMIPHSIFVVLIVQLFGHGAAGLHYPMTMALTLTLGWAMAIAVSPISAMSLITGKLSGVSSHVVGLDWNRPFALTLMGCSVALMLVSYGFGL